MNNKEKEYDNLMIFASKVGNVEIVNQLKHKGLSSEVMQEALYWAMKEKKFDILKVLSYLLNDFDFDQHKKIIIEAYLQASSKGDINVVTMILDSDHKRLKAGKETRSGTKRNIINKRDLSNGKTAMLLAFEAGNYEIVKELLKRGAIDIRDNKGVTTLQLATIKGNASIGFQILKNHANPNIKNQKGETALHHASETANAIFVDELLKYGANPDIINENGKTPVQYAIEKGEKYIINRLLNAPVNDENLLTKLNFIITRANDISSYVNSNKFNKNAFGMAERKFLEKPEGNPCLLEIIAREGSTKDMHIILDTIVEIEKKTKGAKNSEIRVVEKLRHSLPHPVLGRCVKYVKSKYPWSSAKFWSNYVASILKYVILGPTFYLLDLVTDVRFVERMFNKSMSHSTVQIKRFGTREKCFPLP